MLYDIPLRRAPKEGPELPWIIPLPHQFKDNNNPTRDPGNRVQQYIVILQSQAMIYHLYQSVFTIYTTALPPRCVGWLYASMQWVDL